MTGGGTTVDRDVESQVIVRCHLAHLFIQETLCNPKSILLMNNIHFQRKEVFLMTFSLTNQ